MKTLLITVLVLFIAAGLSAVTQLINFDDTSDLEYYFNPGWVINFTNTNYGGLENSGSVNIPPFSDDIWTHKTGFPVPEEGETATVSAYFRIVDDFGYSGIGFAQANENYQWFGEITTSSILGMYFHGGGGSIWNNASGQSMSWYDSSGDLLHGSWYKIIFNAHNKGDNVFDLDYQIWNSDANGTVSTLFATQSVTGVSNPDMAGAGTIFPYFFNSSNRSDRMDNFYVEITELAPPEDGVIVDFPYLADFQGEDPLWFSVRPSKNANSGKQLAPELGKTTLLQNGISKNREYQEGLWVRTLDEAANYAWKLSPGLMSFLISPKFRLIAGQTYEIKYNHRQPTLSEYPVSEGLVMMSGPRITEDDFLDMNVEMSSTDYALRMITVTPEYTDDYQFGILGYSTVDMFVDNFRITQNGDDILTAAAPTVDGVSTPDPAPIFNTETGQPLDTDLHIANIAGSPEITATVSWAVPEFGSQNTGLKLRLNASEGSLAGAVVTFFHNLGYVPSSISYRIVPNAFAPLYNPSNGSWNASQCVFTVPAMKADGDFEVILRLEEEQTLPVELSSFTAIATQQNYVQLNWITQSETSLLGYYVYRSGTNRLETAEIVSNLISAHNTSQEQAYAFTDREVDPGSWYYWLQNLDMNGQMGFHGSIYIDLQVGGHNSMPEIPVVTSIQSIYPNPFNPSTTLRYSLADKAAVRIQIFNSRGQLVRSLDCGTQDLGYHSKVWNGLDEKGQSQPTGLYFFRLQAGNKQLNSKAVLMK